MNHRTDTSTKTAKPFRIATLSAMSILMIAIICASFAVNAFAATATTTSQGAFSSTGYPIVTTTLASNDPNPAIAGELLEVKVDFQNQGGQQSGDITATFVPSYPFTLVPTDNATQDVGVLQAYQGASGNAQSKELTYHVLVDKDAPAGSYDFTLDYTQAGTGATETKIPIDVKTANNQQTITIDKTILIPGAQTVVTFTINNVGNAPLRNLIFTWANTGDNILPVGSDNTRYVKNIDAGQSIALPFTVIADTNAAAGLYKLDLSLSYQDALNSSITKLTSTSAGMYIGGSTDFDVAYSESSSGQISLSVANVGSNPASSVTVSVPQQPGWRVSGSNNAIVGNLNKGDYTAVSFTLQQSALTSGIANASGTAGATATGGYARGGNRTRGTGAVGTGGYNATLASANAGNNMLLVEIAYTDTTGQRQVVDKMVSISGASASGNGTGGFGARNAAATNTSFLGTYGWYIVILVLIIGAIYWYRHKKKMSISDSDDEDDHISSKKKK